MPGCMVTTTLDRVVAPVRSSESHALLALSNSHDGMWMCRSRRIERNKLVQLRTDRAAAAARVEALLYRVHADARIREIDPADPEGDGNGKSEGGVSSGGPGAEPRNDSHVGVGPPKGPRRAFAVIGDVSRGSPAAAAGVQSARVMCTQPPHPLSTSAGGSCVCF